MLKEVFCSLISTGSQSIPTNVYTLLRFPFDAESSDGYDLHPKVQPDTGQTVTVSDPRAGLIWPQHTATGHLDAMIYLDAGDYTELRHRFVRDPLNLTTGEDSTCTQDQSPTPGGQYMAKSWRIKVYPGTPIGVMVKHNASKAVAVTLCEFKMLYYIEE